MRWRFWKRPDLPGCHLRLPCRAVLAPLSRIQLPPRLILALDGVLTQVPFAALAGLKPLDRLCTFGNHAATHAHVTRAAKSLPLPIQVSFERDGVLATTLIASITASSVATKPAQGSLK